MRLVKRYQHFVVITAIVVFVSTMSSNLSAQASRPLRLWVDTVSINVCTNEKSFVLPVRIEDIYFADSLVGFTVSVWYDKANVELDPFILAGSGTLAYQAKDQTVSKDPNQGILYVEAGNTNLALIAGKNKPIFYVSGTVRAPDTLVKLDGWIQVGYASFESATNFTPLKFDAGFVQVLRDTGAAYAGKLNVGAGTFDTLRYDTVSIAAQNVAARHVDRILFSIEADTTFFEIIDTTTSGTLSSDTIWSLRDVQLAPGLLKAELASNSQLLKDGSLLRLILRRKTDSAFTAQLKVKEFSVNDNSCLGKLLSFDSQISAAAIPKRVGVSGEVRHNDEIRVIPDVSGRTITIRTEEGQLKNVRLYDQLGNQLAVRSVDNGNFREVSLILSTPPASGIYTAVIQRDNRTYTKQFVLIK